MAKPRVFVSSAYVGLADLRRTLSTFLDDLGCEPVLFETGGVFFDHNQPLDESCYKAVATCDLFVLIIGGRYGSASSRDIKIGKVRKYNSITKTEYITARDAGLPIFTFVEAAVHSEFRTWQNNKREHKAIKYAHVDTPRIFDLLHDIYSLGKNNFIQTYASGEDIITSLRHQCAGIIHEYAMVKRAQAAERASVPVNSYKLFFYRHQKHLTFAELSRRSGVDRKVLRQLEMLDTPTKAPRDDYFPLFDKASLAKIEAALDCPTIAAGRPDDFSSAYILYYATYKHESFVPKACRVEQVFPTRAVVFDFDGTLTVRHDDDTTWEKIWKLLGYSIDDCAHYHQLFSAKKITHAEWCEITRDHFRDRGLRENQLPEIAKATVLIPGTEATLRLLAANRIKLFILSGSIKQVVKAALGDLVNLFEDIRANELVFDRSGLLQDIVGTRYDFEGKAAYLTRVIAEHDFEPLEVLFVGNSCNDVFASRSGARTLCVNPRFTDPNNIEHWTYYLRSMDDLDDVLPYAIPDIKRFSPIRSTA